MRKRPNLGMWFAVTVGALYFWQRRKIAAREYAIANQPTTVSGSVSQSRYTGGH